MIANTNENRSAVTKYLESLNEEEFIYEFIIPFFCSHGYYLYRINIHGPAEHGKDLIFYRHVPMFYGNEYIAIQAKSEKVTPSNVVKIKYQIERAYKCSFYSKSDPCKLKPHYAILMNSKKHTNDGDNELHDMVSDNPHIKILSQENICELIMKSGIGPDRLLQKLSKNEPDPISIEDKEVRDIILGNVPSEIDHLLDHKLKFTRQYISERSKNLVIEYIYDRWRQDTGWEGTIKPMKWFDTYFDFFSTDQYKFLFKIFEELTSTHPSYGALPYTTSIAKRVKPDMLHPIVYEFTKLCIDVVVLSGIDRNDSILLEKLKSLKDSELIEDNSLNEMITKILEFSKSEHLSDEEYFNLRDKLFLFAYPDEKEYMPLRRRRKPK